MATREKFDYTQQTPLFGAIKYVDVPSYSKTNIGTTGNAYLIRSFIKDFFPFLKTSVQKTSGGSVQVRLESFDVNFSFIQDGITRNYLFDAKALEAVLEPLFEGQGFDGMTDSTFSKPLPTMYNDDGQDVSYGYNYLFVNNGNIDGRYEVNLDLNTSKIFNQENVKYAFVPINNSENLNNSLKGKTDKIPVRTLVFLKEAALLYPPVSSFEVVSAIPKKSDLVILEKGESNNLNQNIVETNLSNSNIADNAKIVKSFIDTNIDIFGEMSKDAPELLEVISQGLKLIQSLQNQGDYSLEPFTPLENKQELEDDLDLKDLDLEELDLTGLEDDLELNDDMFMGENEFREFDELKDFVETELMPSAQITAAPVDIENLDALQKNILMILDKPPAKGKGTLYNEMDQSEISVEVDEKIANEYIRFLPFALDVLIALKLVTASNGVPVNYRLIDDKRTSETIANIKNELSPLTPTVEEILRILYRKGKLSSDDIQNDLANVNIILPNKSIFNRLIALRERGLINEINALSAGIVWQITSLGNEYIDKLPKRKTGGQYREEQKQAKIEKEFGSLDYDFYLVLKILYDNTGMLNAKTVTTILQQQFNKNPKYYEFDILSRLRELLSKGLALEDTTNLTEHFEISVYGEDVFKYLSEQESRGLYPKSKSLQQTVAARPSPTESATLYSVGTIKKGNDGNNWEVKESSKGVKRWFKMK